MPATTTDFTYSPVTRLGLESPTNDVNSPQLGENASPQVTHKSEINNVAQGHNTKNQLLELPKTVTNQVSPRGDNSQEVIDTICGTDKSNTSLIKSNESPHSTLPNALNAANVGTGGVAIKPQSTTVVVS